MAQTNALTASLETLKSAMEKAHALRASYEGAQESGQRLLLAELIEKLLETKEKVLLAKEEVLALQAAAPNEPETIEFDGLIYWKILPGGKREGPFCQRCRDLEQRWIRLYEESQTQDFGTTLRRFYSCKVCKSTYDIR